MEGQEIVERWMNRALVLCCRGNVVAGWGEGPGRLGWGSGPVVVRVRASRGLGQLG